ncbi:MAG: cysteine hydrolase family protein [Leptolyngbyaceae cyanobacterium]
MAIENAALLVIDVQKGFDDPKWGSRNNPEAEANIGRLIAYWRTTGRPILHIQHCSTEPKSPLRLDRPGCAFKAVAVPKEGEPAFKKTVNSAFIGTDLEAYLRDQSIHTLIIVGLTTNHCVSTTTRMAGNLGFTTFVVSDATATFDLKGPDGTLYKAAQVHDISLASLHGEFATVVTTETLMGLFKALN